jgi:hypothetical protein
VLEEIRWMTLISFYPNMAVIFLAADNNTGMYNIHYSIEHIAFSAENTLSTTTVILTFKNLASYV